MATGSWWGYAVTSAMPMPVHLVAEGIGFLMLFGTVFMVWHGLTNKDRIVFDSRAREVRFEYTRWLEPVIPFGAMKQVVVREAVEERSSKNPVTGRFQSENVLVHRVEIVRSDGGNTVVDKSSDAAGMVRLGTAVAGPYGVPFETAG